MPVHAHIPASHRWMTVEEAAKHFGVVPMRIRVWIMDGNIPVDPRRGVLLSDLLRQRDAERQRSAVAQPTASPAQVKPETHVLVKMPDRPVVPPVAPTVEPPMIQARAIKAAPMLRAQSVDMAVTSPPEHLSPTQRRSVKGDARRSKFRNAMEKIFVGVLLGLYYSAKMSWIILCYFSIATARFLISFAIGFILHQMFTRRR